MTKKIFIEGNCYCPTVNFEDIKDGIHNSCNGKVEILPKVKKTRSKKND